MTSQKKARDERGRFTKDNGQRYEVTVWNVVDGDIVAKNWSATEEEVAEMETRYGDEPYFDVQVEPLP